MIVSLIHVAEIIPYRLYAFNCDVKLQSEITQNHVESLEIQASPNIWTDIYNERQLGLAILAYQDSDVSFI
jgi:hypothetical protein